MRNSFDKYYMPLVEVKDFTALINNKPFFDQPLKTNKKHMKKLLKCQEMIIIQQGIYQIISIIKFIINLRQTNMSIPQQINFFGKLKEDDDEVMLFIAERQQKSILDFSLDALIVTE